MTFIPGQSGNPSGRPKLYVAGSSSPVQRKSHKRNWKRELERFISRNGTAKELSRLYDHLESTSEQARMLQWVYSYVIPKPTADSLSEEQMFDVIEKMQKEYEQIRRIRQVQKNG